VEVRPEANDRYFAKMLDRRGRQVLFSNNCSGANTYYFDRNGDAPLPAATSLKADRQSGHFNVNDYAYDRSVSVINSRNWLP
jgi:hypothetical protein